MTIGQKTVRYAAALAKELLASILVGLICGGVGVLFLFAVGWAIRCFTTYSWLLLLLPVSGLLIAGLYRLFAMDPAVGTDHILSSTITGDPVQLRAAPLIFVCTVLTHLCGGSAGREGAALLLGGSVGGSLGKAVRLDEAGRRMTILAGMTAVFSALFGTPVTAAVFCVEVACVGATQYAALLPCMIASFTAHWVAQLCGFGEAEGYPVTAPDLGVLPGLQIVLLGLGCALVGMLFCHVLHLAGHLYKKHIPNLFLRAAVGGAIVIALTFAFGRDYNSGGMGIALRAVQGEAMPFAWLLKIVFTAVTLGAGFKGGEIIPTIFVGATFGCAFGGLIGLDPGLAAAVGVAATFCAVTNCPLASILLAAEMFGGSGIGWFALAVAVAYVLSGSCSLYAAQRVVDSKLALPFKE